MRWSLILSTFIAVLLTQSLLSFALVTTQSEITLERRVFGIGNSKGKGKAKDVKAPSKIYRTNSFSHPYGYDFSGPSVTRQSIPDGQRQGFFSKMFNGKKYDADHIYEEQMYHNTLQQQGISHSQLSPALQAEVQDIMNRPENMAPIPPGVNRSKGQLIKMGMQGKSLRKINGLTRSYSLNSYPSARHTSEDLQRTVDKHGHRHQGPTFRDTLHNTMVHAGVLNPGQPSPPNSPHRTGSVSKPVVPVIPRHPSTQQSTHTGSVSQPVVPVIPRRHPSTRQPTQPPSRSSSTRRSARLNGQSASPYHIPSGHPSTSQLPQTGSGPVIPQRTSSRRRSGRH